VRLGPALGGQRRGNSAPRDLSFAEPTHTAGTASPNSDTGHPVHIRRPVGPDRQAPRKCLVKRIGVVSRALGCSFEHRGPVLAVRCEGSSAQEVLTCVVVISGAAREISCDSWEEVVVAHCCMVEQGEYEIESSLRTECSTGGDGSVEFDHGRGVDLCEPVVERRDTRPIGVGRCPGSGVAGGDRGLERVRSCGAL
jgi:hypothetical protein